MQEPPIVRAPNTTHPSIQPTTDLLAQIKQEIATTNQILTRLHQDTTDTRRNVSMIYGYVLFMFWIMIIDGCCQIMLWSSAGH